MNPAELFRHDSGTIDLGAGDFLFREGENGDKMYVLLEGEADIRVGDLVVETAGPRCTPGRDGVDR
jgi:CRP-like cAMP-binding protein